MTAAALALRLPNYWQSIWFDEACMSTQRIGGWAQLLTTVHVDVHPPLYLGFMFVWNALLGDSEVAMRLPPLVCGLASIPLTYAVGQRLFGRSAGLCAAALLTVSPVHIWYSIEARLYAPMLCLVLVSVELFHRLFQGARRGTWLAYGAALLGLITVHYYAAAYVLLSAVLAPFAARRYGAPRVGRRIVLMNLVALGLLAGWVGFKLSFAQFETSQHYLRPFTFGEMYRLLFQWFWTGDCISAGLSGPTWQSRWVLWVAFQALGVALAAAGITGVLRARRERPDARFPVAYLLVLPVLLLMFSWVGFPNTYIERSAIAALPFLMMIAARGLVSIRPRGLRTAAAVAVAGM